MTEKEFIDRCVTRITEEELDFKRIVMDLFCFLRHLFCSLLAEILVQADEKFHKERNASRYTYKYKKEKTVTTILGDVTYNRHYYMDQQTGDGVALLDKRMGIQGKKGSNLAQLAVMWAIRSDSFREAEAKLADLFGESLISHETIRQLTYAAIRQYLEQESEEEELDEKDKEAPDVVVIEADEIYPGCQDEGQKRFELKFAMAHTGWQPVSGYGDKTTFNLKEKLYLGAVAEGTEFWERFSRKLFQQYDLSDTVVVINGDGAAWIRQGVSYFPQAIYSYNTYHVKKKLKKAVCHKDQWVDALEEDIKDGDLEGIKETLVKAKIKAEKLGDSLLEERALEGLRFVAKNREYLRDYRERVEEKGGNAEYLHSLGASEAIARQFAKRLKDGRSWKKDNANLMAQGMAKLFEGEWEYRGRLRNYEDTFMDDLEKGAGRLTDPSRQSEGIVHGKMPGTEGTSRGLAKVLNMISSYDRAI